jgi:hypothetical protein
MSTARKMTRAHSRSCLSCSPLPHSWQPFRGSKRQPVERDRPHRGIGDLRVGLLQLSRIPPTARAGRSAEGGGAFAAQWGAPAGQAAFALLLVLPPFQDVATTIVSKFAADSGMNVKGTVVVFALALGFIAVVLLQTIGTIIVHTLWWTDKR